MSGACSDVSTDRDPFPTPPELEAQDAAANHKFASEFVWKGKRLVALDRDVVDKLQRKRYSASSSKSIAGCSARWAVEKQAQIMGPFNDAVLGTAVHSINEHLFTLPPAERTIEEADRFLAELALERWPDPEDISADEAETERIRTSRAEWTEQVEVRNAGYLARVDMTKIVVIANEMKLELDFHGVPTVAYLDRVDDLSEEFGPGKVGIVDYKSSKKIPDPRYPDDHKEQQRLYKALYEAIHGIGTVARVTLEYTRLGTPVNVEITDELVEETVGSYVKSWGRHNRIMKSGEFLVKKSTLCGWCLLVNTCPTAKEAGLVDRKGGLPTAEMLPIRVVSETEKLSPSTTQPQPVPGDCSSMSETTEATPIETVKGAEGRPWEFSIDGVRNPGSYEYTAAFGATSQAMKMIAAASDVKMTASTLTGLSATLHRMACEVQRQWLGGVDAMASSHTRCRGAVATVIETMPAPFGGTSADWDKWVQSGIKRALAITSTVTAIVSGDVPAYPWLVLATDGGAVREGRIAADKASEADANREAVAEALAEVTPKPALTPDPAPPVDTAAPVEATPLSSLEMSFDF